MPWGIAAAGVLSAAGGITGGILSGNAAKEASNAQTDAAMRGLASLQSGQRDALAYLDPFRQYGLNAGATLESMLYSPEQRLSQIDSQKAQLQAEVDRLKAAVPVWERYPILSGKNASERRAEAFSTDYNAAQTKLAEAQAKLDAFNKQVPVLQAQAQRGGPNVQESPWYQFQSQLLGRNMDRYFAARGLTGSGFEAESNRQGLLQLGAQETENQFNRLFGLYGTGANAASAGAGSITGTSQGSANLQAGIGNAQAQGIIGANKGTVDALTSGINAVTGAAGTYLNYNMFQNLIANNKGYAGGVKTDPVFNSVDSGGGSYDYLRPTGTAQ